jgi:hypothetical protein
VCTQLKCGNIIPRGGKLIPVRGTIFQKGGTKFHKRGSFFQKWGTIFRYSEMGEVSSKRWEAYSKKGVYTPEDTLGKFADNF